MEETKFITINQLAGMVCKDKSILKKYLRGIGIKIYHVCFDPQNRQQETAITEKDALMIIRNGLKAFVKRKRVDIKETKV